MRLVCRILNLRFALAYLIALGILAIGTFGMFGAEKDPLAGVLLIPLGLPWNLLVDLSPEELWPWLGSMAPAVNLMIFYGLCRLKSKRLRRSMNGIR